MWVHARDQANNFAAREAKNTQSEEFNPKGKLLQKTDERGRICNAKGKYQGKVKPVNPVESEKRDAKGKLVEVLNTVDTIH